MRAINHAITGAAIGLSVSNPVLAVPLALGSHFVCDAIPHYGPADTVTSELQTRGFLFGLIGDAILCGLLVMLLAMQQPHNWISAALCAFVATAPDFAMLPGYLRVRQGGEFVRKPNWYMRFASNIQWFERPIGALVEIAWFIAAVSILLTYL